MVFSSSTFLFVFLPAFLAAYLLCPGMRSRNACLLLASLLFYAWGEPVYVALMLLSILVNWALALAIDRSGDSGWRRRWLVADVVFNMVVMGFFKYQGFVAQSVNTLLGTSLPDLQLPLPIGISFYTLQALSYVVDVYRGRTKVQRSIALLGMYVACFPQLVAGPIVRYADVEGQIRSREVTLGGIASGMRLFVVGLAKKVLLANVMAILADDMLSRGGATVGAVGAWGGVLAFTFQIYFDFGGYSDMAIGLGRMLGFSYRQNFDYPYVATSGREFWRRWHISLSSFFRDYVYIPLGGNRVPTGRWVLNMLLVWAVTGLWHGAAWNFVAWGLYWGVVLVGERLLWGQAIERLPRVVRHAYAALLIVFGWSLFWVQGTGQLVELWKAMLGVFGATGEVTLWEMGVWEYLPVFAVCVVASTPAVPWARRASESRGFAGAYVLTDVVLLLLLVISAASVVWGSFNPFIYFRF